MILTSVQSLQFAFNFSSLTSVLSLQFSLTSLYITVLTSHFHLGYVYKNPPAPSLSPSFFNILNSFALSTFVCTTSQILFQHKFPAHYILLQLSRQDESESSSSRQCQQITRRQSSIHSTCRKQHQPESSQITSSRHEAQ